MRYILVLCILFFHGIQASEKKTVCLNMIVKDEAKVIEKCLDSVKSLIDYWVIVDTGSSDQTKEIIQKCLADIPGELHERPWVDFAHNRNEALQLAKGNSDYLLFMDADEVLAFEPDFSLPTLEKEVYFILVRQVGAADVKRNGLLKSSLHWKWEGVLHEVITCPEPVRSEVLKGVFNLCNTHNEGSSGRSLGSQEEKYLRDAKVLEEALKKEPQNSRYAYYLGISYAAAGKAELAKKSFERRLSIPSCDEQETFLTLYNLGLVKITLEDLQGAAETFLEAYVFRPTRAESLFQCAKIYRQLGQIPLGYVMAKMALTVPYPEEDLCVEYPVYDHTLLIEFANCALLLGKFEEGYDACCKLLANSKLPEEYKPSVKSNHALALSELCKRSQ